MIVIHTAIAGHIFKVSGCGRMYGILVGEIRLLLQQNLTTFLLLVQIFIGAESSKLDASVAAVLRLLKGHYISELQETLILL